MNITQPTQPTQINKLIADELCKKHETFYRKDLEINGVNVFVYNYLLSDKKAFEDDFATELRGLTITHENARERVFLSCPKFFNINEIESNLEKNLRLKTIKKVSDKLDGSLIQFIQINGDVFAKSKQSFSNDQAKLAQNIYDTSAELEFFVLDCWANNYHPLFELVGPSNKVVLDYPKDELILIAVRNDDGEFIDIDKFNYKYSAKSFNITLDEIIHSAKNDQNIEGYVIKHTDGSIVKVKTLSYLDKHRLTDESDSYKIILRRLLDEDMDDIYAIIAPDKKEKIQKLERDLVTYITHFSQQLYDITKKVKGWDRKDIANTYKSHEFFNVLMKCLNCDIDDIKDVLSDTIMKKYQKEKHAQNFFERIAA